MVSFLSVSQVGWGCFTLKRRCPKLCPLKKRQSSAAFLSVLDTHSGLRNDSVCWIFTEDRCELHHKAPGHVRQRGWVIVSDRTSILPILKLLHSRGPFSTLTHLKVLFSPACINFRLNRIWAPETPQRDLRMKKGEPYKAWISQRTETGILQRALKKSIKGDDFT